MKLSDLGRVIAERRETLTDEEKEALRTAGEEAQRTFEQVQASIDLVAEPLRAFEESRASLDAAAELARQFQQVVDIGALQEVFAGITEAAAPLTALGGFKHLSVSIPLASPAPGMSGLAPSKFEIELLKDQIAEVANLAELGRFPAFERVPLVPQLVAPVFREDWRGDKAEFLEVASTSTSATLIAKVDEQTKELQSIKVTVDRSVVEAARAARRERRSAHRQHKEQVNTAWKIVGVDVLVTVLTSLFFFWLGLSLG